MEKSWKGQQSPTGNTNKIVPPSLKSFSRILAENINPLSKWFVGTGSKKAAAEGKSENSH